VAKSLNFTLISSTESYKNLNLAYRLCKSCLSVHATLIPTLTSALDEPKGFGLLLKPTKKAFLDFAHVLDKVVSENINRDFFAAQRLELNEEQTKNGQTILTTKGTLRLLEEWLTKRIRIYVENGPATILAPLKEIRTLRQGPAHKFVDDEFSLQYQKKKEKLILDVYISISNIRMFFQTHPRARNYAFPEHLKAENILVF
jgi:hypothetical protein